MYMDEEDLLKWTNSILLMSLPINM